MEILEEHAGTEETSGKKAIESACGEALIRVDGRGSQNGEAEE